jgi:hypothetical protein
MRKDIDRKLIARYAIRETMGLVVMGVALFWSAGQIDWWPAWAAIAVWLPGGRNPARSSHTLEDRTSQAELTGYVDYTRQVRYRLLPGIW